MAQKRLLISPLGSYHRDTPRWRGSMQISSFPTLRWFQWTSELLDTYDLIQLYDRIEQRDEERRATNSRICWISSIHLCRQTTSVQLRFCSRTWPGLAWAAKRQVLETHGLFDAMIVGSADTYMSIGHMGRSELNGT